MRGTERRQKEGFLFPVSSFREVSPLSSPHPSTSCKTWNGVKSSINAPRPVRGLSKQNRERARVRIAGRRIQFDFNSELNQMTLRGLV